MNDDEMMDTLLRDAMAEEAPQLSPAFEARLMRRVRSRRLTGFGRLVIVTYAVRAAALTAWLMRDVPTELIVVAFAIAITIAAGASAYARHLASI